MIQMEVDLHSPSFRALRSFSSSTKRARSPETSFDRPSKRPSLAVDHSRPESFSYANSSGNASPASSSRFPSEDWVHQADGLTIDSPVIPGSGLTEDRDEDMNMEPDEPPAEDHTQRPDLPPLQTMSYTQTALYPPQQHHHHQHTPLSATSAPTLSGPLVTVLPPTPALPPLSTAYIDAPQTRPSTPGAQTGASSAMLVTSFAAADVTSPRKQRFTMGPRTDCIKCQLGVKGHSVHY
ncbi:hypothetical protein FPV67DRAFT_1509477 [Lyophyllum atratum]|nr:hypothetical protein FPV67DRAFT_1509477 [Lyophyllum atratum]